MIMNSTATLIDNIFVSLKLHRFYASAILLDNMSDHLPTLVLDKQTKLPDKEPPEFESCNLSDKKVREIKDKLMQVDWTTTLWGKNSDENFDIFLLTMNEIMDKVSPIKSVKMLSRCRFMESWMIRGLEISSRQKKEASLNNSALQESKLKYIEFHNNCNKIKRSMKKMYYMNRGKDFAQDSKKLWSFIKKVIKKTKYKGSIIPYITTNRLKPSNPSKIANEFCIFYSTLGSSLAAKSPGSHDIDNYLKRNPRNLASLVMRSTTVQEVHKTSNSLPNKTCHGHDGKSNNLFKMLSQSIAFPLCKIFNSLIEEGVFPRQMKMAEVIPLYKRRELDMVVNYRPISLLITRSKLLEKLVYCKVYKFLEKNKMLYNSQYSFHNKHLCEHTLMELCGKIIKAKDQGMHSTALFLDLLKAFDTINHAVLLKNLEQYGMRGTCLNWFENYW